MNVNELISELQKYSGTETVGYYPTNAHGRGSSWRANKIQGVEMCDDGETVAIVGGFE